jgi:hypothetical protein
VSENFTRKLIFSGFWCSLHYALVAVGTPGQTFMVALDTGSDLFWLPCQCDGCTPPATAASGSVRTHLSSEFCGSFDLLRDGVGLRTERQFTVRVFARIPTSATYELFSVFKI